MRHAFGHSALGQRCQWHKRENVVSYLPKGDQATWRRRLHRAYQRPTYAEARAALTHLQTELEDRNQSAARSLAEGLEDTLTSHRLGVFALVGLSFKTTNCRESINALVEERRWIAGRTRISGSGGWPRRCWISSHGSAESRAIGTCHECVRHCNKSYTLGRPRLRRLPNMNLGAVENFN